MTSQDSVAATLWQRSQAAHLLEIEGDYAQFRVQGTPVYLKSPSPSLRIEAVWGALERPTHIDSLSLRFSLSLEQTKDLLKAWQDLGLVFSFRPSNQSRSSETISPEAQTLGKYLAQTLMPSPGDPPLAIEESDFFEQAQGILSLPLKVISTDGVNIEPLIKGLHQFGYQTISSMMLDRGAPIESFRSKGSEFSLQTELIILVGGWQKVKQLARVQKQLIFNKRASISLLLDHQGATLGPTYLGKGCPCLQCLLSRRKSQQTALTDDEALEDWAEAQGELLPTPLPSMLLALSQHLALEIAKLKSQRLLRRTLLGVYEFDLLNHRSIYHHLFPVPYCPSCGIIEDKSSALEKS